MDSAGAQHATPAGPQQQRTVAVIGAGLSGLVAAKCLAQAGLLPTVFDRRPWTGGMWSGASDATYRSLRTNLSRHTCCFSDFPWPSDAPLFPSANEMSDYLEGYAAAFLSSRSSCAMELGCKVTMVEPAAAGPASTAAGDRTQPAFRGPWRVTWRQEQHPAAASTSSAALPPSPPQLQDQQRVFDFVVVASGSSAAPYVPHIPGLDSFPGTVLHSSEYRGPETLAGARAVAVVGGSASAVDIAADLAMIEGHRALGQAAGGGGSGDSAGTGASMAAAAGHAAGRPDVHHVVPRQFWVVPRSVPLDATSASTAFVPLDLLLARRSRRPPGSEDSEMLFWSRERCVRANTYWAGVCGDQVRGHGRLGPFADDLAYVQVVCRG